MCKVTKCSFSINMCEYFIFPFFFVDCVECIEYLQDYMLANCYKYVGKVLHKVGSIKGCRKVEMNDQKPFSGNQVSSHAQFFKWTSLKRTQILKDSNFPGTFTRFFKDKKLTTTF